MEEKIARRMEHAISEHVFPGCVVGIVHKNSERTVLPFGRLTYEANAPKVTCDTVYDLASVTKSIPMASLTALLLNERKLGLTDTVKQHLPELQNDHGATIEDLLTYRVHGVQLSRLRVKTFEEVRTHALEHSFDSPPGESYYTNLPAFFMGLIIERLTGETLAALAHKHFFEPLGMSSTTFFPIPSVCAPTEIDERGEVRGLPHDESAYLFAKARRSVGHAGLFSTAPDLLKFLEALLRGELPYVTEAAQKGLGWQTGGVFLGANPKGRFGKTGFTGTSIVCDMERGIAFVILSNRTYPKRSATQDAINSLRADIAGIIF